MGNMMRRKINIKRTVHGIQKPSWLDAQLSKDDVRWALHQTPRCQVYLI